MPRVRLLVRRLAFEPHWRVVVCAQALIHARALVGTAETEATGAAAVQVGARAAHERRVPLTHHVVVAATLFLRVRFLGHAALFGAV